MKDKMLISLSDFLYFVSIGLLITVNFLFETFFSSSMPNILRILSIYGSILLLLINEIISKEPISYKIVVIASIMAILTLYMFIPVTSYRVRIVSLTPIFMFCSRNIDTKKIAKFSYILLSTLLIVTIVSSQLGLIRNYFELAGGRNRFYLGFLYSLYGPTILLSIAYAQCYLSKEHFNFFRIIVIFLGNIYLFYMTNSRLAFLLTVLVVLGVVLLQYMPSIFKNSISKFLMKYSFIMCSILSILVTYYYNPQNNMLNKIDSFLSRRLFYGKNGINIYGIHLFPQKITFVGNGLSHEGLKSIGVYNYVDCLYLQFLLRYGVILFVLFLVFLTYVQKSALKKGNYHLLFLGAVCAVQFVIDDLSLMVYFNCCWLLFGADLMKYLKEQLT